MKEILRTRSCPCGSLKQYNECCLPRINGTILADTPEQLMRSRYSAYCIGNENYLTKTWHSSTRPKQFDLGKNSLIKWIDLKIISAPPPKGAEGSVEFIARFKENGKANKLHECSRFKLEDDKWFYIDGEIK